MKNRPLVRSLLPIGRPAVLGLVALAALLLSACAPMDTYPSNNGSYDNGSYGYTQPAYAQPVYPDSGYAGPYDPSIRTRTVCRNVQVRVDQPQRDPNHLAGTAIGAIAGGLLGHTVGGGSGKTLATVGGAVVGGYVGNQVQANGQRNNAAPEYRIERQCTQERY